MLASVFAVAGALGCASDPDAPIVVDDLASEAAETAPELQPKPALRAFMDIHYPDCDRPVLGYEVFARTGDSPGIEIANPQCVVTFDDGTTASGCIGEHLFATAGSHIASVVVTDPATGRTATTSRPSNVPEPIAITLTAEAPECGLELSYAATVTPPTFTMVFITPVESVEGEPPLSPTGTVRVTAPGTYTVEVYAEDERALGPICERRASLPVTVIACSDEPPPCGS